MTEVLEDRQLLTVFFVDPNAPVVEGGNLGVSWDMAYLDLQLAFTAAQSGDTIKVADGTYTPGGGRSSTFKLKSGVEIYGGYAGSGAFYPEERDPVAYPTYLSGEIMDTYSLTDNTYHVVTGSGANSSAVLDGFIITAGYAVASLGSNRLGGGLYISAGSPTISNCTFINNYAQTSGCAMYATGASAPVLTNCTFVSNSPAPGYSASGGGIYLNSCTATITDSSFYRNTGGALVNVSSSPTLKNCAFYGNTSTANGAGISNTTSSPTLTNCVFVGNKSDANGGAIYNATTSAPTIVNCTFNSNVAAQGGALYNLSSNPIVANSIIWNSTIVNSSGTPVITYSNIQGGYAGTGNINSQPVFVRNPSIGADNAWGTGDDDYGDMQLGPSSPGVDAGSNSAVTPGTFTDLTGANRYFDMPAVANTGQGTSPIVDIGAYEATNVGYSMTLTPNTVFDQQDVGTVVGTLSTSAPNGSAYIFLLVNGNGGVDNKSFKIVDKQLCTNEIFNSAIKNVYSIRVRMMDPSNVNVYTDKILMVKILKLNHAPRDISLDSSGILENQSIGTIVGMLSATDDDAGETFTYALVSGSGSNDNASFSINGSSLKTTAVFNYETKNSYNIRVKVTDSGGLSIEKAFTINVNNVNETPTDLALSGNSIAENMPAGTTIGNLSFTDPDAGDTATYSLVSGTGSVDNGYFGIQGGSLVTAVPLDYEAKSTYSIRVRATDAGGLYVEKTLTITVTNVSETPTDITLSGGSVAENQPAGAIVGTVQGVDSDKGETFTYKLVSGPGDDDNAFFTVTGNVLKTNESFDYETRDSYSIRMRVTDSKGLVFDKAFTIGVDSVNEAPVDLSLSPDGILEELPVGTTIGYLSSIDPDFNDTFTYELVSGAGDTGNGSFAISGDTLQTAAVFHYKAQNSYSIRVRATDAGGLSFEKTLTVRIIKINDAPTDLILSNGQVAENLPAGTAVGELTTTDPQLDDTFVYSLVDGDGSVDNASFTISGNQILTAGSFDYETKRSFNIRVRTTDPFGLYFEKSFVITVGDVNDAPTGITLSNSKVAENQPVGTTVGALIGVDPDAGDSLTYQLVDGAGSDDNNSFTISGDAILTADTFNFEAKKSYSIRVLATDANGLTFEKAIVITVTNVNETPTNIVLSNSSVYENLPAGVIVGAIGGIDPDAGDTFSYALVSGEGDADNASFTISGNQLKTAVMFNREEKNSCSIRVRATDAGGLSFEKVLTVTIANVNEQPTGITLSKDTIIELLPVGTPVGVLGGIDPDIDETFTYTLIHGEGDVDNISFTIAGNVLKTASVFNYFTKNSYSIRVKAVDAGGLSTEKILNVKIARHYDPPTNILLSSESIRENSPADSTVGVLSSVDPDVADAFVYTLVAGEGDADNASFTIENDLLKATSAFNFESKNSYNIRIRSTDAGGFSFEKAFVVTVENVNEMPTVTTLSNNSIQDNLPAGTVIGSFSSQDQDAGETFYYSLVSGDGSEGNAAFTIVGNTLLSAVKFNANVQDTYSIRVRTRDSGLLMFDKIMTINIAAEPKGSIMGKAFNDLNGNGTVNTGEKSMANALVYLDLNNNGKRNTNEPIVTTTKSGQYSFSNLPAGNYQVRLYKAPTGFRASGPAISGGIALGGGVNLEGQNIPLTQKAQVSGTVFYDKNKNGKKDASETGRSGVKVFLDADKDGVLDKNEKSVMTDAGGNFTLTPPAGTYSLKAIAPKGYSFSSPSGGTFAITVKAGQTVSGKLFGVIK